MTSASASLAAPYRAAAAQGAEGVRCTHCSLPVPSGFVDAAASVHFCCAGCRTAHDLLHQYGLADYYALGARNGVPVHDSGRSYAEFDHEAFHALYVTTSPDGLSKVALLLEGVHCASCVWLVERVPLLLPGVARSELQLSRSLATIEWDASVLSLSQVARRLESLGYPPHPYLGVRRDDIRRREDRNALARIGVAGAIAINVMLPALAMYSGWVGHGLEGSFERYFRWISLLLTVPALLGPGRVFFSGAWAALRTHTLHLDLPIAIALLAGFVRGAYNTWHDAGPIYFDGVTVLIFLLLVGRYLQLRGQRAAADASELLYSLTPRGARVLEGDGSVRELPAAALLPGMVLAVRAGETIAADGVVADGDSAIDNSLLTGESQPARVRAGDMVFAGTVNLAAPITVRVERAGEESRVARILLQVEEGARRRAPVVLLANRLAGWFVAVVLILALATYLVGRGSDPSAALDHAIALLVVTCPCALAMATPLAVTVATGRAARRGIVIRGGDALESLSRPGVILLDKTGTVTEARVSLVSWDGPSWVEPLVRALEFGSSHPIAAGLLKAFDEGKPPLPTSGVSHVVGAGVQGNVSGHQVVVGSPTFVMRHARGRAEPAPADPSLTPVWVAVDGHVVGHAALGDPLRPDSARSIAALRNAGWEVRLLSGDAGPVVMAAGRRLGLSAAACRGDASPEDKLREVERLSAQGGVVVMVGDGINDAAAIAAATVGIAVHGGAEASLSIADVYLTTPGLAPIVDLVEGARRTMRIIRRNIACSFLYNLAGVAFAIAGVINPLVAAILMPLSSLTVVLASWYGTSFRRVA